MKPILVEKNAKNDFDFNVNIIEKSGCHLQLYPDEKSIYFYSLPYKSKNIILQKVNKYYEFKTGGWTTQYNTVFSPKQKSIKIFHMNRVKKPFHVIIISQNHELSFQSLHVIHKKGFSNNQLVYITIDEKIIPKSDVQLIGYVKPIIPVKLNYNAQCILCMVNPINTSILHGDFAHSFCCSQCSPKLQCNTCPICRLPIDKIIYNYISLNE
jgi:hypothetical protein